MNNIDAVLFDLDNTLTHRDLTIQAYSQCLLNEFKSDLLTVNQSTLQTTIEIIRRIDNGGYPKKEFLTHPSIAGSVANALIQELNWNNLAKFDVLTAFWFEQFGRSAVAMNGAEILLKNLKQRDYKLAVISNGGQATRLKILEGLGFLDYFDEVFSSESVGIAKPEPEIFLHSCAQIQVAPARSLYIGDHPINDYSAARAAGLNALLLDGFHPTVLDDLRLKENTIQRLDQVLDFLI